MSYRKTFHILIANIILFTSIIFAQGVTTSGLDGFVSDADGNPLVGANVVVNHEPSGAQYGTSVRDGGLYTILNMRVGGPYTVTVSYIGHQTQEEENVYLFLGQTKSVDFVLEVEAIEMIDVVVEAVHDDVLNPDRTGAATFIGDLQLAQPSGE